MYVVIIVLTVFHVKFRLNTSISMFFRHHQMRIFNLNAPAVFLGPVLGRSAGVPSRFNLF